MYAALMSSNRNVANLSIVVVKTLVKMAGFGRVADMIDGSQECLNLLADIKNDALGNPNAEMIRSLNGAVKSELDAIQDALKHDGLSKKQIKKAVAQISEAACKTIKELAEDDDALIRAIQQPEHFIEDLKSHAAPLPDGLSTDMQDHYETLLDQIAEKFLTLAPWSPSFDRVALTSLLRCFPALSERIDRLEQHMDRRFDHIELGMREDRDIHIENNQLLKGLSRQNASPIFDHVVFGSRPDVVAGDSFVPRGEQEQLNALITDPTRRRTVLVGMRGCGKTQLAAALAEECEDKNWSLVAWVNAVSSDSIKSSLVELAKKLKIDTSDQPTPETIIRRCFNQLKSEDPSDRLIIFDNVENIDDLRGLVPRGNGLRVVATTTNNTGWEHQGWDTIKVGVFHRDESINYLLTATESTDRDAADTLAHRLGDLPLALAQAAATTRNGNLSLARYLDRLDCYRSERVIRPVPGDYYTDDVATALCMAIEDTLENLEDGTKQAARYILGALALLAESGVPTRWLDPTNEQQDDREVQDTNRAEDEAAHDALTELIHRSIVQQSADKATTMLHRLQAQVLRESWDKQNCEEAVESTAVLLRKVNIDKFRRNDTASRRRETLNLIEQLRSIGGQNYSQHLLKYEQVTDALGHSFLHADDLGLPFEALTLEVPVNAIQDLLGLAHHVSLAARNNLASAHGAAGNIDKSTEMYEQLFQDCIRILGKDHPDTLAVRNNLAYAHESAGNLDEAINMDEILLKDSMRILGKDHPDTLSSRNNLAYTYGAAGNLDKAIDMYEQLLQDSTRVLGKDHPDTLSSRNNLAGIYLSAGRITEAIDMYEEVLKDRMHILGKDHPHVLASRNNLAGAYQSVGRITEAIDMYEEVLKDRMHILGKDHPHVLASRNNLAGAYQSVGRITEAIDMYEQLVKDSSRILGESHPDTLASRNNLAGAYHSSGLLTGAINTYGQTLSDCLRILGSNHPLTAKIHRNLKAAKRELEQQEEDSANEEREQED